MIAMAGMHQKGNKGYLYFDMSFARVAELFNDKMRGKPGAPIQLKKSKTIEKRHVSKKKSIMLTKQNPKFTEK